MPRSSSISNAAKTIYKVLTDAQQLTPMKRTYVLGDALFATAYGGDEAKWEAKKPDFPLAKIYAQIKGKKYAQAASSLTVALKLSRLPKAVRNDDFYKKLPLEPRRRLLKVHDPDVVRRLAKVFVTMSIKYDDMNGLINDALAKHADKKETKAASKSAPVKRKKAKRATKKAAPKRRKKVRRYEFGDVQPDAPTQTATVKRRTRKAPLKRARVRQIARFDDILSSLLDLDLDLGPRDDQDGAVSGRIVAVRNLLDQQYRALNGSPAPELSTDNGARNGHHGITLVEQDGRFFVQREVNKSASVGSIFQT